MLKIISKRKSQTLMNEIMSVIRTWSEIGTDCWTGDITLKILGGVSPYVHKTVNHTRNFFDPETRTCTNDVESILCKLKVYLGSQYLLKSKLLPEHND